MSKRARAHWGHTLVELLIAMVMGAAILSIAGTLVARMIASNSAAGEHLRGVVALSALGQQFRRDVHATTSAVAGDEDDQPPRLTLNLADGSRVEYEALAAGLLRAQKSDAQSQRRELFALRGMKVLDFKADHADRGEISIVIGRLAQRPGDESVVAGQFEITAVAPRPQREETRP
jgi:hypothetical protein